MLFVTDYTRHPSMPSTHGSWCPPKLAEVVLPVELWDSATARGPAMKPGEFYSIRNMKLKWSGNDFVEGKMVEGQKIAKLDEDQLEGEPHLVELLKCVQLPRCVHMSVPYSTSNSDQAEEGVGGSS